MVNPISFFKRTTNQRIGGVCQLFAVIAFSLFGIVNIQAQNIELQAPQPRFVSETEIRGVLRDVYSNEPLQFVQVIVEQDGKTSQKLKTNELGEFVIIRSNLDTEFPTVRLKIDYLGQEVRSEELEVNVAEIEAHVDAGIALEKVVIYEPQGNGENTSCRMPVHKGIHCGKPNASLEVRATKRTIRPIQASAYVSSIYRPLDEWLMMNYSEIHHSGRW